MTDFKDFVKQELEVVQKMKGPHYPFKIKACENVLNDVDIDAVHNEYVLMYMLRLAKRIPLTPLEDDDWELLDFSTKDISFYRNKRYKFLSKIEDTTKKCRYIDIKRFSFFDISNMSSINKHPLKELLIYTMHELYPIYFPYDPMSVVTISGTVYVHCSDGDDEFCIYCLRNDMDFIRITKAYRCGDEENKIIEEIPMIEYLKKHKDFILKEDN